MTERDRPITKAIEMEWKTPGPQGKGDKGDERMGMLEFQEVAKLWPSFAAMARDVGMSRQAVQQMYHGTYTAGRRTTILLRQLRERYEEKYGRPE